MMRRAAVMVALSAALGSCGQLNLVADEVQRVCDRALTAGDEMSSAGVTAVTRAGPLLGARGFVSPPEREAERRAALREFEASAEDFLASRERWEESWAECWTGVTT